MTATPTLQPHPLDAPGARGLFLAAELTSVAGYTAALIALIGGGIRVWHPAAILLALPITLIANVTSRRLRREAWEATPGGLGRRGKVAPLNPARLLRPLGDALTTGAAGFWVLNVRPSDDTHTIVLMFATYVGSYFLGVTRRPVDLAALALRLSTPLLLITVAIARLPFPPQHSLILVPLFAFPAVITARFISRA